MPAFVGLSSGVDTSLPVFVGLGSGLPVGIVELVEHATMKSSIPKVNHLGENLELIYMNRVYLD